MFQPQSTADTDQAEPRPPAPQPVRNAVKLMYAGAILSAVGIIVDFLAMSSERSALSTQHPHYSDAKIHSIVTSNFVAMAVFGLITIALWILMARTNGAGKPWARIVASVLFAFSTLELLTSVLGFGVQIGLILGVLFWLPGLGAIFFLWRKESSEFFRPT